MKRLAIFCDGTWNRADQEREDEACPTNVVKLALRVLPSASGVTQVTYYDSGVGTGNFWDRFVGGAFGLGLEQNLLEAYRFVMHNYEPGDALYLFGFSRGAYTARSLAGMIRKCGILKRSSASFYKRAMELYRNGEHPDNFEPASFRKNHCVHEGERIPIEFIGVWDTVGSLGIPLRGLRWITAARHRFHDVELSRSVKHARHALAIDEHRAPFEATRWAYKAASESDVRQVWFAGVHSDIGGGLARGSNPADGWGLSDITLEWMSQEAEAQGLALGAPAFPLHPNPLGSLFSSKVGLYRLTPGIERAIGLAATAQKQPTEHTEMPDPTQSVHPSVLERWDADRGYRPANLRAYFRRSGDRRGEADDSE